MRTHDDPSLHVLVNTASKFLMLGCGVLLVWYLTRRLGVISYGEYSSMVALAIWCRFPVDVLLQSSIVPLVAASKTPDRVAATYMRATLFFASTSSFAALVVGLSISRWTDLVTPTIWIPLCVEIFAQSAASCYLAILAGKGLFFASSILFGIYWIIRTIASIFLVESGFGAQGVAIALPVASALEFVFCAIQDRSKALLSPGDSWKTLRSETAHYGVNAGLERLLNTMDLVLMKFFGADARAIGFYAAALNLGNVLTAISNASNSVYLQSLTQAHGRQQTQRFLRLSQTMLRGRLLLVGLSILAVPFLPVAIRFIFGNEFESIRWVVVLVLLATSLRVLLAAGRILNRATGEPLQIRKAIVCLILLNTAGLALAIYQSQLGPDLSESEALWQATLCAIVPVAGIIPMTLYSLKLGLASSGQSFPWNSAIRILAIGSLLAGVATRLPIHHPWGIGLGFLMGVAYLGLLSFFGDLNVPWSRKRSNDGGST